MKTLVLDTATEQSFLALFDGDQMVAEKMLPKGLHSSHHLILELESLLSGQKVQEIVVGVGPGSYTGIRVGVAVARSLSFAWKIPVIGVVSLCSFVPQEPASFASVVDAKIGGLYIQIGTKEEAVNWEGECQLVSKENWDSVLGSRMIIGPKVASLKTRLLNCNPLEVEPSPEQLFLRSRSNPLPCEILYLRKTQAELEKL